VRAAAVERATCRREHPVEISRCGRLRRIRPPLNLQATPLQHAKCSLCALFHLRCIVDMPVAIGRCIDEHKELFPIGSDGAAIVAVLRTDIDRGFARQHIPHENIIELCRIVR